MTVTAPDPRLAARIAGELPPFNGIAASLAASQDCFATLTGTEVRRPGAWGSSPFHEWLRAAPRAFAGAGGSR